MIPKNIRLGSGNYSLLKAEGTILSSLSFGVLIKKRNDDEPAKAGIIVSKKVSLKAVERNRAKRILSEAFIEVAPKVKRGYDLLFLGKKELLDKKSDQVTNELEKLLKENALYIEI